MRVVHARLFVALVVVGIVAVGSSAFAVPVNNWQITDTPGVADKENTNGTYSGLNTNSPIIGTGAVGSSSSNSGIIHGTFTPLTIGNGETIQLTGSMTITGTTTVAKSLGFQFGLFYEPGVVVDDKGWAGYFANNTSEGTTNANHGNLRARDAAFETTWISSSNTTKLGAELPSAGNGTFANGTYSFSMTVERVGDDLNVSASLLGTGATVFTNVWSPRNVTLANLKTFTFDRVGFWVVSGLNADQVALSNIDVSVVPEPTSIALLGAGLIGLIIFRKRR